MASVLLHVADQKGRRAMETQTHQVESVGYHMMQPLQSRLDCLLPSCLAASEACVVFHYPIAASSVLTLDIRVISAVVCCMTVGHCTDWSGGTSRPVGSFVADMCGPFGS